MPVSRIDHKPKLALKVVLATVFSTAIISAALASEGSWNLGVSASITVVSGILLWLVDEYL